MRDLGRALAAKAFWLQADSDLMDAWVADLMYLNYSTPAVKICSAEVFNFHSQRYELLKRMFHIYFELIQLISRIQIGLPNDVYIWHSIN